MKRTLEQMVAEIPAHYEKKEDHPIVAEIKGMRNEIIVKVDAMKQELKTAAAADKVALQEQIDAIQRQADALDQSLVTRHTGGSYSEQKGMVDLLKQDEGMQRLIRDKRGTFVLTVKGDDMSLFETKTTIDSTALGQMTSGVLAIDRTPGIVAEARQALRMRNVIQARPTDKQIVDYVKVNAAPTIASLQLTEGVAKIENAVTFTTASAFVKTIATWIPMTRQALDDFSELGNFINSALPYYVNLREEVEFLHGGGGSTDIYGLVPQASALQAALALPAYNKSDLISAAIQQVEVATETQPTFFVCHPTDYWQILRTKDANRNYVFNGGSVAIDPFWGLTPIRTTKMGIGNFLVGSGDPSAVQIRDRMEMQIEISTEHQDFFTRNLVAVRAEKRTTLCVYRPGAFVFGSFSTSP